MAHPEILHAQLRALVRVSADHPVRIMFPMVATLEELELGVAAVGEVAADLGTVPPEIGVMVEIPAAALAAAHLARVAAFFSVGTNDLTQYTLAADRGNEDLGSLADALHPSVLRLIATTARGGSRDGRADGGLRRAGGRPHGDRPAHRSGGRRAVDEPARDPLRQGCGSRRRAPRRERARGHGSRLCDGSGGTPSSWRPDPPALVRSHV